MGKREARPGIPKTLILAEQNCMTEEERTRLFKRLKAYFKRTKFTQIALAEGMHKSTGYISKVFSGLSDITVRDMVFICRLVGKNPVEFLEEVLEEREYKEESELEELVQDLEDNDLQELQESLATVQNILAKESRRRKNK